MQKNLEMTSEGIVTQFLKNEGIMIEPDFEEKFWENAEVHYGGITPSISSVRTVIRICNYWKRYCADENEFSKLVCTKIYSMAKIHAAVITSNPSDDTCYIGNLCKLKEGVKLPMYTATTASYKGAAIIQEGFGGIMKRI